MLGDKAVFVFVFGLSGFEMAAVKLAVVHEVGTEFFDEDLDAAGNWNGNDSAR